MTRTRTLSRTFTPTLGLAALAALASLAAPITARAQTAYTVVCLTPAGSIYPKGVGISGSMRAGTGQYNDGTRTGFIYTLC